MPEPVNNLPIEDGPDGPLVAVIAYDQLCVFEFGIAAEVFGLPRPEMGKHWFRYVVSAVDRGPMRAAGGLTVLADGGLELLDRAEIIVIPGWRGADAGVPDELSDRLIAAKKRGALLVSICSGVFVLAAAGLLEGVTVTTHWRYFDALRSRYPETLVSPGVLYVDTGQILTSAGSASGVDLCIHLVRRFFGTDAANSVARRLVVPAHREGGQVQVIDRPVPKFHESGRISRLLDDLRRDLQIDHKVSDMARAVGMSERTFRRRFEGATGTSPNRWLLNERVLRARELLESTGLSVEAVASTVGFGTAAALRHHFRENLGSPPSRYRAPLNRVGA